VITNPLLLAAQLAQTMADEEVFSRWSEAQLRGYLAESGAAAPPPGAPRAALARAAAEAARRAEVQLVAARAPRAGGAPAWAGAAAGAPPPAWAAGAPPPQVPQAMPRPGGGRKRALFIGCNYAGTSSQLSGCVNDARVRPRVRRRSPSRPPLTARRSLPTARPPMPRARSASTSSSSAASPSSTTPAS
jgi:hypothetical protein